MQEKPKDFEKPAHTLEIEPLPDLRGVFTATVNGQRAVICLQERNRAKAADRFESVNVRPARLKAATAIAKKEKLPVFVAVVVRVANRWNVGYVVSRDVFWKFKQGDAERPSFNLAARARLGYEAAKDSVLGVRCVLSKRSGA